MKQNLETYTSEDLKVWQTLFNRQVENLARKGSKRYLNCLDKMAPVLNANSIPDFEKIGEWFKTSTGWKIEVVPGLIPVEDFFVLLANKQFCSSTWLRTMEQLDYLEEPDMFHDIFGHIPLLADPEFSNFAQRFGQLGTQFKSHPFAVKAFQRLYWFTIEFGVIQSADNILSYGARIMSSYGETNRVAYAECRFLPFDLQAIIHHAFDTDVLQEEYYVIKDFAQLTKALDELGQVFSREIEM
ncbi:MAG: phenylalanine-4-hydroxylase [Crocinitomicaceae bacterium]